MDKDLAKVFAVQTTVVASIVELLVDKDVMDQKEVIERLYELLSSFTAQGGKMPQAGPITHLIAMLEDHE